LADFPWLRADPLARVEPETHAANMALRDYAAMGVGRSQRVLAERYVAEGGRSAEDRDRRAVASKLRTLEKWSRLFAWTERVEVLDVAQSARALKVQQNERLRILRQNVRVLTALQGVAVEQLALVKKDTWKPSEVVSAISTSVKLLSEALGADPTSLLLDKLAERLGEQRGDRLATFVAELLAEPEGADG
jgi:hypothetical protein